MGEYGSGTKLSRRYYRTRIYSFEYAAELTGTSVKVLERYAVLGLIEPTRTMLSAQDVVRIAQI
jgi:MerR family transcriptional regulator/heat shock protein HspR/chaperone modulatory protein CbpM